MNNILFIGFGRVGKTFLKNFLSKNSFYILKYIILYKFCILKKRYIESIFINKYKIFISLKYKGLIKKSNIIVELVGDNFFSKEILLKSILDNKKYITANKKMLYKNIKKIKNFLYKNIFFESSIGASIPLTYSLKDSFVYHDIKKIESILNGTTNYITSFFCKKNNNTLNKSLKICFKKGFSEKNPISDISGFDSYNKIFLISNIININIIDNINIVFGIEKINLFKKILFFLKKKIKLISTLFIKKNTIYIEVYPYMIKKYSNFNCGGIKNIIKIKTFEKEKFYLYGPGAGTNTTSLSILSEIFKNKSFKNKIFIKKYFLDFLNKKVIFYINSKKNKIIFSFLKYNFFSKIFFFKKNIYIFFKKKINNKRILIVKNTFKENLCFLKIR